jgi:MYXO-CTERM domain-containing protein
MKRLLLAASAGLLLTGTSPALTIMLDAESLKDALGQPMDIGGLVVLTAATSGTFFGPTPTSFAGGDELVLKKWDLSAFQTPGVISDLASGLAFTGNWNQGDALRLYWYPELVLSSAAPGAGTAYGTYTDALGLNGSAPWVTPGESDTISLKLYTSDASFLIPSGGANAPAAGVANQTVVPEPATATLGLAGVLALATRRRRTRM